MMRNEPLTTDERKLLYKAARHVADLTGRSVELLLDDAIGQPMALGADYMSNFRKGQISQSKAMALHYHLQQRYPAQAHQAAPSLFTAPGNDPWSAWLDEHADHMSLTIITPETDSRFGIVQRVNQQPKAQATIKLGQAFGLRLKLSDIYQGQSIALVCFQGYQGKWHSVPMGRDGTSQILSADIGPEQTHLDLPQDEHGNLAPLIEHEDLGFHRFVIFTTPAKNAAKLPSDLGMAEPTSSNSKLEVLIFTVSVN